MIERAIEYFHVDFVLWEFFELDRSSYLRCFHHSWPEPRRPQRGLLCQPDYLERETTKCRTNGKGTTVFTIFDSGYVDRSIVSRATLEFKTETTDIQWFSDGYLVNPSRTLWRKPWVDVPFDRVRVLPWSVVAMDFSRWFVRAVVALVVREQYSSTVRQVQLSAAKVSVRVAEVAVESDSEGMAQCARQSSLVHRREWGKEHFVYVFVHVFVANFPQPKRNQSTFHGWK